MEKEFSRDDIRELAAGMVEQILQDPALGDALAEKLASWYRCPPRQLCCSQGYGCTAPFVCRPGFNCTMSFANYPP